MLRPSRHRSPSEAPEHSKERPIVLRKRHGPEATLAFAQIGTTPLVVAFLMSLLRGLAVPKKREKKLHYLRAEWLDDVPTGMHLEACIKHALGKLTTVQDRTIIRDSGQNVRAIKRKAPRDGGCFLHIAADTPGEETSIVPKTKRDTEELEVRTSAPPADAEYMDGDAFLFVKENHVCICATGMRDGAIRQFLYEFFSKAKIGSYATKFELMKSPRVDKLQMLKAQGVKEIALKASLYQATARYENRKSTAGGVLSKIAKHFKALIQEEIEEFDDSLRVRVIITSDRRSRKYIRFGERRIERLAENVVDTSESNDDFEIVTGSDQVIRGEEIFLSESVLVDAFGKSVKCDDAWRNLADFYSRLQRSGALSQ